MGKNLAFIFNTSDLKRINTSDFLIIPVNSDVKEYLNDKKIDWIEFEEFFPKDERFQVNRKALKWARFWYRGNTKVIKNLSFALYHYFSKKLFEVAAVERLMKVKNPSFVFLGEEVSGIGNLLGSDYDFLSPVIISICKHYKVKFNQRIWFNLWWLRFITHVTSFPKLKTLKYSFGDSSRIVIAANHYHILNILPLIKFLIKKGKVKPLILGNIGSAYKELKSIGADFIDYQGEISIGDLAIFLILKIKFILEAVRFLGSHNNYRYKKISLNSLFVPKLISLILSDAAFLSNNASFFAKIVDTSNITGLLTLTNSSSNLTYIDLAKSKKIPTIELQHGIVSGMDLAFAKAEWLVAWGKIPNSILVKGGADPKKVIICGWPVFEIYKGRRIGRKVIRSEIKSIAFLAQHPEGIFLPFGTNSPVKGLEIFFAAISKFSPEARIVVRLHPRADIKLPYIVAKKYGIKFTLSRDEPLSRVLRAADIIVGQTTTATLEAVFTSKPVIYLQSMDWPYKFVEGTGSVFEVKTAEDLSKTIDLIWKGVTDNFVSKQKEFTENYCNTGVNAVEEINSLIEKLTVKN